jgi:toluene monooxygenase system protein E
MTPEAAAGSRRRRTWSRYTERRVPTEYEFVSHDLHWHYKPGQVPWEMSPEHVWNRWYIENRDSSPFTCSDWNQFRDPAALVYRTYVRLQDEAETYVDGVIDDCESRGSYAGLPSAWLAALREGYTPFRYAGHALLMAATYLMAMAPSSYISNAVAFQAGDELRRIQRIAYQTRQLGRHYPAMGFGDDRARWEDGASWQPLREVLERLLATKDWGKVFAQLNLVVKPAVDAVFNGRLAEAAASSGDDLTALMHRNLQLDGVRSRRWSTALVNVASQNAPANVEVLRSWTDEVVPAAIDAVVTASVPLSTPAFELTPEETRHVVTDAIQASAGAVGMPEVAREGGPCPAGSS